MIPKNIIWYKPSDTDVLNGHKDDVMLELNCHAIGTIQSFDPTIQTATATVNYQKVVYQQTSRNIYSPVLVAYPLLVDCPVQFDFGGAGGTTKPVNKGDECLILFNDRDMDAWFVGQKNHGPNTARLHSFADALIIVGIKSLPNVIQNFDASRPALRNFLGDTYVAVGPVKIELHGNGTTLNTLLQNLVTAIKGITTLNSDLTTGVVDPASQATLAAVATAIGGLLE